MWGEHTVLSGADALIIVIAETDFSSLWLLSTKGLLWLKLSTSIGHAPLDLLFDANLKGFCV